MFRKKLELNKKLQDSDLSTKQPLVIDGVMCRFLFKYKCLGEKYRVEIEAKNLNKAMFNFATYYHKIDEVYSITNVS